MEQTRPEKSRAMSELVYALRNAIAERGSTGNLNLAECMNALGQTMASILAGAYDDKNREVVLAALPDLIRAYLPQWDKIYADYGVTRPPASAPMRMEKPHHDR
jgi:hypothetical protein